MSKQFPLVSLGQLLSPISRVETVNPEKKYHILGAHWYAKGLYTKEVLFGSEIRANKIFRVENGDFVYNRLFAWKGSFAVASKENHGCYVSNEFPCYRVDNNRLVSEYLWFWFQRESAWQEALGLSAGGTPTSRNRLKEHNLLSIQIPLPPLEEQQRIVVRIESLTAKIEEARVLRKQAVEEAEAIVPAVMHGKFNFDGAETTVRDFATVQGGFAFTSDSYDEKGTHQIVRIGNVRDGYLDLTRAPVRWNPASDKRVLKYELKPGDLVISMTGTREKRDYGFIE